MKKKSSPKYSFLLCFDNEVYKVKQFRCVRLETAIRRLLKWRIPDGAKVDYEVDYFDANGNHSFIDISENKLIETW